MNLPTDSSIQLEEVARIGSDDEPDFIGYLVSLTRLDDGRFALFDMYQPGVIRLFDPTGSYLVQFGRRGEGPGEFLSPIFHHLDVNGDTLRIFDRGTNRVSLWSPDGTTFFQARRLEVVQPLNLQFRDDGSMLANGLVSTETTISRPVVLMDRDGKVLASFGERLSGRNPRIAKHLRSFFEDDDGTLWIAPSYQYRVEKWNSDGVGGYQLDTIFFPGTIDFPTLEDHQLFPLSKDSPEGPGPLVYGIWREPGGPVWTVVHEAHPDWRERYPENGDVQISSFTPGVSLWRTRVDALHPSTGVVLASSVFEENLMGFIGGGYLFSYALTEAQIPFLKIWRLALMQDQPGV